MAITIKEADPTSEAATVLIAELTEELGKLYPRSDGNFVPQDAMIPRSVFVIAWDGDVPVGCGALRPAESDTRIAEIKRMYVRQSGRGKGISKRILAALEAAAREFEYDEIWLETGIKQTAAIGLYEGAGYERMDCYEPYTTDPMNLCYHKGL